MANITAINDTEAPSSLTIFTGKHHQNGRCSRVSPLAPVLPGNTPILTDDAGAYPGGKGHLYQKIINLIPPHRVYIETHAGGAAVLKNKKPARLNIAIDLDPGVVDNLRCSHAANDDAPVTWRFINGDAVTWLSEFDFQGDEFIYADPPYLMETRKQQRPLYRFEYTIQDHVNLLTVLKSIPCKIMVSGYWSRMYADMLNGWRVASFKTRTRGGSWATEFLWMNYPQPTRLHDYRYLGDNYRERERIKRKKQRWAAKWAKLDILERQAILAAMEEVD